MPLDSTKRQESSESSNNQLVEFWTSPNQLGCPFFFDVRSAGAFRIPQNPAGW